MLTFVNLSGGNAYDGSIISKTLRHDRPRPNRTVFTLCQILQHLRPSSNKRTLSYLNVAGYITPGHNDGEASELHIVANGGEEVDDGKLTGDDAGREDAAGGDDGTATKIVVFSAGVGVGMDEDGKVYAFIGD